MLDQALPDFSLPATGGTTFELAAHAGNPLVIYFYPKDSTPGCTTEAQGFRDHYTEFQKLGCEIIGISRDSLKSHANFTEKQSLPYPLISDTDEAVCTLFGVIKMKNMYGKQVRGIERSTFLIGQDGTLLREWRGVKVPGHVEQVLSAVCEIS
jgi:peroxiredoxin Q/BCP